MPTILIIEDDLDVAEMLNAYFSIQGYSVLTMNWGEDGLQAAAAKQPDLIILDIRLPDIDGFEVARRLRANRQTSQIPILFLTEKRDRRDRLHGLEIGGDDYITKPFDIHELRLRVRNALSRVGRPPIHNRVTDLPEGDLVDERLSELLAREGWAVLTFRFENLDAFGERYGFIATDDTLRATSVLVLNTLQEFGTPGDLLGHLTADQFLLISTQKSIGKLQDMITKRVNQSTDFFYPTKDLKQAGPIENRLALKILRLTADDGPFEDLSSLKSALLKI